MKRTLPSVDQVDDDLIDASIGGAPIGCASSDGQPFSRLQTPSRFP